MHEVQWLHEAGSITVIAGLAYSDTQAGDTH